MSSGTNTELLVVFSGTSVVFETLEVLMLVVPAVVRSKPAPSSVPVGSFQADGLSVAAGSSVILIVSFYFWFGFTVTVLW